MALVDWARQQLASRGSCSLDGFLRREAIDACVAEIEPLMKTDSFHHAKEHNIYFDDGISLSGSDARALARLDTSNLTVTGDQLSGSVIRRVYEWDPLRLFLQAILDKPSLYRMADPLACLNVMGYGDGDRIGWHFDRAEFTVTLLLQSPEEGGEFQYRCNLRDKDNPNYEGVARLLNGEDLEVDVLSLLPGTLNIFAGFRSAHRITPVAGARLRLIAILSFMERADVSFSAQDRQQFYGRSEPLR